MVKIATIKDLYVVKNDVTSLGVQRARNSCGYSCVL